MNIDKFINNLNILCKELDDKYDINSGYCYYVAYLIARFLENEDIEYQFIAYREKIGGKSVIFHYGLKVDDKEINPGCYFPESRQLQYITQDSNWMYNQHKQNYKPNLCEYWKDYYKRFVNKRLKEFLNTYKNALNE